MFFTVCVGYYCEIFWGRVDGLGWECLGVLCLRSLRCGSFGEISRMRSAHCGNVAKVESFRHHVVGRKCERMGKGCGVRVNTLGGRCLSHWGVDAFSFLTASFLES